MPAIRFNPDPGYRYINARTEDGILFADQVPATKKATICRTYTVGNHPFGTKDFSKDKSALWGDEVRPDTGWVGFGIYRLGRRVDGFYAVIAETREVPYNWPDNAYTAQEGP